MNTSLSKAIFEKQTSGLSGTLLEIRSWQINECLYPILDVTFNSTSRKPLRIRMDCENYNEEPASIQLLNPDGTFLVNAPNGHGVINNSCHPKTNHPFICSPGSREYHQHPSHTNDNWDNYKDHSSYDLGGMLTQIYNSWNKTTDA